MSKLFLASLIVVSILFLSGCDNSDKNAIDQSKISLFDKNKWGINQKLLTDIDGDNQDESIYYLKSISPLGTDAADKSEYGVNIIISKYISGNEQLIFSYSPSEDKENSDYWPIGYYREDSSIKNFYLEDITGDITPEIILKAGITGASDWSNCLSIITYNKAEKTLKLINKGEFCSSFNSDFKITKLSSNINGSQIVKATPLNDQVSGNKIEQSFKIDVYTWDGRVFAKYKSFTSSKNYEGANYALEGEAYLVQKYFYQ